MNDSPLVATGTYLPSRTGESGIRPRFRVKKLADGSVWCHTIALPAPTDPDAWVQMPLPAAGVLRWDAPKREVTARYTSHITLTGAITEPEYESAMVEEALSLSVAGVNSGHIWVVLPIEGGEPVVRTSEDYPTPDGPDELGDVLVARAEFFATDPVFEVVQPGPAPCRCGFSKDSITHVAGYVSGLPGHTYDPAR